MLNSRITIINTADDPLEMALASGVIPSELTFQMWTASVSAGRSGFKKLVSEKMFQLV